MKSSLDLGDLGYLWFTYDLLMDVFGIVSPKLLMIYLWFTYTTYDLLMIYLWFTYDLLMIYLSYLFYLWFTYDLLMIYLLFTYVRYLHVFDKVTYDLLMI